MIFTPRKNANNPWSCFTRHSIDLREFRGLKSNPVRRFTLLFLILFLSCGKTSQQAPVQWKAAGRALTLVQQARQELVQGYYLSRVGENPDIDLTGFEDRLEALIHDTLGLTNREIPVYNRAVDMLESYLKSLSDTARSFDIIRWTGQAPYDPSLEEATTILAILALQHGQIDQVEEALNTKITPDQKRALKSYYGSVLSGSAAPEMGFWPNPEPGEAGEGLVVEVWPETQQTAGFAGICGVEGDSLVPDNDTPEPVYYIYGSGYNTRGVLQGDSLILLDKPLRDPDDYYVGLPGPALWWEREAPESLSPDSCLNAFTGFAEGIHQSFDSVSISSSRAFWVWPGHPAHVLFVNAFKRGRLWMFTLVVEDDKVVYSKQLDPDQGFMGTELVATLDLDYDRVSEIVFSYEGEESRSYTVLKKHKGVWWSVVQTEARLVGFE